MSAGIVMPAAIVSIPQRCDLNYGGSNFLGSNMVSIPQRCDLNLVSAYYRLAKGVSIPQRCDLNEEFSSVVDAVVSFNPATVRFE